MWMSNINAPKKMYVLIFIGILIRLYGKNNFNRGNRGKTFVSNNNQEWILLNVSRSLGDKIPSRYVTLPVKIIPVWLCVWSRMLEWECVGAHYERESGIPLKIGTTEFAWHDLIVSVYLPVQLMITLPLTHLFLIVSDWILSQYS